MPPWLVVRPALVTAMALVLVTSAAGCRRRALNGGAIREPTDQADAAVDASTDGEAATDLVADAGAVDLSPPPPPAKVFESVVLAQEDLQRRRFVECFGASPAVIAGWVLVEQRAPSGLAEGRAVVDDAKAAACLAAVATATCAEIAAGVPDRTCSDLLSGTVAPGGACRADHECAGTTGQYRCAGDVRSACGGRCTLRPPSGDRCGSGECAYGTICERAADGAERCVPSSFAGTPCNSADGCGANDYCRWTSPPSHPLLGTCAPRVAGAACSASWECPFAYKCVFAAGAELGICTAGRPVGSPCRVDDEAVFGGLYNDCAITLSCLPGAGGGYRCSEGFAEGELCGTISLPNGASVSIPCRDGYCAYAKPNDTTGTCRPFAPLGGACAAEWECGLRRACLDGACVPASPSSFPVGAHCPLGICADGARCAEDVSGDRVCVANIADGQSCAGGGQCAGAFSTCKGGVCTPCP